MSDVTKGGFHIGSVGGNASFGAGGDIVAGDKITQTTTTTTVNHGFKRDDDKQKIFRCSGRHSLLSSEMRRPELMG